MAIRVLGVVPARGGSKGLPGKNIRPLCGRPLLEYTADAALYSKRLTNVVLSTDDPRIAEVGRRCGLDVPFLRPRELAQDDTPTLPVVQHALREAEMRYGRYDIVCLLEPTSPLRRAEEIDACIDRLAASDADSAITVLPVPVCYNPHWVYFRAADGTVYLSTGEREPPARRQDLPPAFHRDSSIYATRRDVIVEQNSLYGQFIIGIERDPSSAVNIDGPEDWSRAERLLTLLDSSENI